MRAVLESLLFVVGNEGLTKEEIKNTLELDDKSLENLITEITNYYLNNESGIEIAILGNRLKLVTKKEYKPYIQKLMTLTDDGNLSNSALETLAIIAYNQPVTRLTVDEIRGVASSHILRKLVYKNLICEIGRSETAGRPILYGTTPFFLDYFGLADIKDLPSVEVASDDSVKDLYESKYNDVEE